MVHGPTVWKEQFHSGERTNDQEEEEEQDRTGTNLVKHVGLVPTDQMLLAHLLLESPNVLLQIERPTEGGNRESAFQKFDSTTNNTPVRGSGVPINVSYFLVRRLVLVSPWTRTGSGLMTGIVRGPPRMAASSHHCPNNMWTRSTCRSIPTF